MDAKSAAASSSVIATATIAVPDDIPADRVADVVQNLGRVPELASKRPAVTVTDRADQLAVEVQLEPAVTSVLAGLKDAERTGRDLVTAAGELLGVGDRARLMALTVRTGDTGAQRARGLLRLVGLTEIAQKHGRTKQAADWLVARPDFPSPAAKLAAGSFWYEDEVDAYLQAVDERRVARAGQSPTVRTPSSADRGRLAALLEQQQQTGSAVQLSADLQKALQEPADLVGAPLAEAIDVLGGVSTVATALGVDRSTVQRWRKGAQLQAEASATED